jgi:hypothetical protein
VTLVPVAVATPSAQVRSCPLRSSSARLVAARRPKSLGVLGDDVGGGAALRDDALDVGGLRQPSAERGQHVEQLDEGGERVDPLGGVARGMGGPPVEPDPVLLLGGERRPLPVVHARVEHQGGVDTVEHPRLHFQHLAAPAFLGRTPHRQHRTAEFLPHGMDGECRAEARRGDQVVPAGVTQAGQGVVLQQQRHGRPALARTRGERGRQPCHLPLHDEPRALQLARQQGRRTVFGEGVLGVAVQRQGDVPQGVGPLGDLTADAGVQGVGHAGHVASRQRRCGSAGRVPPSGRATPTRSCRPELPA